MGTTNSHLLVGRRWRLAVCSAAALLGAPSVSSAAQVADSLPFAVGERLEYRVKLSRLPTTGRSLMTVEADSVRGQATYLLRFDFSVGF